jgi:hypothetical protein
VGISAGRLGNASDALESGPSLVWHLAPLNLERGDIFAMIDRAVWRPIQGLGELAAPLRTARSDGVFRWGHLGKPCAVSG